MASTSRYLCCSEAASGQHPYTLSISPGWTSLEMQSSAQDMQAMVDSHIVDCSALQHLESGQVERVETVA